MSLPPSTINLAPSAYPLIWEAIAKHASVSLALALRATCTELREMVDRSLLSHLVAIGDPIVKAKRLRGQGPFRRGYLLTPREGGGIRLHLPPPVSTRGADIRRRCVLLDIVPSLNEDDLRWLARLASPHTLRVSPHALHALRGDVRSAGGVSAGDTLTPSRVALNWTIIHARVVVIPAFYLRYTNPVGAMPGGERDVFELPDRTRRVVLYYPSFKGGHLHPAEMAFSAPHVVFRGRGLRELVLVFSEGEERTATPLAEYISSVLSRLPKVTFTVVGLERFGEGAVNHVRSHIQAPPGRLELRTFEDHRAAIGASRWSVEMELPNSV